jgi:hypothetical protein
MIILIQGAFAGLMSQVRAGAKQTTDYYGAVSLSVFLKTDAVCQDRLGTNKRNEDHPPKKRGRLSVYCSSCRQIV